MDEEFCTMRAALRQTVGKVRARIAFLRFGREMTQAQIARKLGIRQPTVSYHLDYIRRHRREIRQAFERLQAGTDPDADRLAA